MSQNKREITKINNRKTILEAAVVVFAETGLGAANVRDIVRESGLSPGTFYNYFNSKEEIFNNLVKDLLKEISEKTMAARRNATDEFSLMKVGYDAFLKVFIDKPMLLRMIARNQTSFRMLLFNEEMNNIAHELEIDIKLGMRKGLIPKAPTRVLAWAMFGAGFEVLIQFFEQDVPLDEISTQLAHIFLGGLQSLSAVKPS